jgi:hypothetical protein
VEAYRRGGGVSWAELGDNARDSQAALNRPWFESALAPALASAPEVEAVLRMRGNVDAPSIRAADANAQAAGVADRAAFRVAAGQSLSEFGPSDAAFVFECVHDMPRPVDVLAAMHEAVRADGLVVIMDEAVADDFTAPGDPVEQVMYGYSTLICLPAGLSSTPSEGTGTVMRRGILTDCANRAGFRSVQVLPIEEFGFWRFYRLLR